jgi:hypothetical protein
MVNFSRRPSGVLMPSNNIIATDRPTNTKTLGALWFVYGLLRLAMALFLIVHNKVATVIFGALLTNVANPFFWMNLFHFVYTFAIVLTLLAGIVALLAALALLADTSSARTLSLTAAFLSLSEVPFGTTLGTYTLVLFLR